MSTKIISSQQKLRGTVKERSQREVPGKPPEGFEPKDTERRLRWVEQLTGHDLEGLPLPRVDEIARDHREPRGLRALADVGRGPAGDSWRLCPGRVHRAAVHAGRDADAVDEPRAAGHRHGGRLPDDSSEARAQPQPCVLLADDHRDRQSFLDWISDHADSILAAAESTTRHGRLLRVDPTPIQQWVVLDFVYDTGNAAGQNMVTLATEAACRYIQQETGFHYYLESGFSSDKKPSRRNLMNGRGHSVTVEFSLWTARFWTLWESGRRPFSTSSNWP